MATLSKGYDLDYIWRQVDRGPARDAASYYIAASESGGEPPGRWWGPGARALGLEPGGVVDRKPYDLLFGERKAPDGTALARPPGSGRAAADIYARLLAAEPQATAERRRELRLEATGQARQSPLFFDLTLSLSKSISIFHASLGENARLAREVGDPDGDAYWSGVVAEVDAMIWDAVRAGFGYFQREAGYTRTGSHGRRAGGRESGQWHEADLVVAHWLQHTSRDGDMQLHVHSQIAHVARTATDGKWRAPDSLGYNEHVGAVGAITAQHLEEALTRRFGLETAVRVTGASAALLTRSSAEDTQHVIISIGFPAEVEKMSFDNGQGIIGAVMLSQIVTALPDTSTSFDLSSPPDLKAYGLRSALCTPMLEDGKLWGTLSVFDVRPREWTADDQRVLSTLGSQGVVAVRNAELYDDNQRSIWELKNLQEALQAATSTLDLGQVLQKVLAGAAKASSAQIGCLALDDGGRLVLKGGFGTDSKTAEKLALGLGGDICRGVMSSGEAFMEAMERKPGTDSPLNPRAVLCVPMTLRGKPLGVLFLANYQVGRVFTNDHRNLVTELAAQAAVAIDNATLFKDREEVILSALEALASAVDARDPYTAGHSQRVTQYALMIARQMRYSPQDQSAWVRLERGVRLHDIGKIGVPDAVLQKPGKLTDEEFEKMKTHPTVGFNILSGLKMLTDELIIVRSHHERYDGRGYPDRKKGDQLPIFAWIASAADAIDAMTSDRPYRKGMSMEIAIDQVRQGAGTHFHPDVAEAVLDAAHNGTLKMIEHESMYSNAPAIGAFENPTT